MSKRRVINGHTMQRKGKQPHSVKPNRAADRDRLLTAQLLDVVRSLAQALGVAEEQIDPNGLGSYIDELAGRARRE